LEPLPTNTSKMPAGLVAAWDSLAGIYAEKFIADKINFLNKST
jgi:hypothetical protein